MIQRLPCICRSCFCYSNSRRIHKVVPSGSSQLLHSRNCLFGASLLLWLPYTHTNLELQFFRFKYVGKNSRIWRNCYRSIESLSFVRQSDFGSKLPRLLRLSHSFTKRQSSYTLQAKCESLIVSKWSRTLN